MKHKILQIKTLFALSLLLLTMNACKKADNFYSELQSRPEAITNYKAVYGIGDTLILQGRLNPGNNLTIRIGDADAEIVAVAKISFGGQNSGQQVDEVKVLIDEEMGIGVNRPVTITSSGILTEAPSIEIIQGSDNGIIADKLKLTAHYTIPRDAFFLNCTNGKGSVYFWNPADKSIRLIKKDGSASTVFTSGALQDDIGAFSIITFNGGGVDPQENNLYFSVLSSDGTPDNAENTIHRFISLNLTTGSFTVLNRTLVPNNGNERTFAAVTPFEGTISTVKLPGATGIYPDSKGNVYVLIEPYALALLSADGSFKYLFKIADFGYSPIPLLTIWDEVKGNLYNETQVQSMLPGVTIKGKPASIAPDQQLLFITDPLRPSNIQQVDLANRVSLQLFSPAFVSLVSGSIPYISGSFSILNNVGVSSNLPFRFGLMALPEKQLISLYYQGVSHPDFIAFPAWGVLDFKNKRGNRYAPGKLITGTYQMTSDDLLLNYDEDGMLYMTANGKATLVKTVKQ